MGDPKGFMKYPRKTAPRRPVELRLKDWKEVYADFSSDDLQTQASRCMDCGIPFCNYGCPLGNLIPEWNDLAYKDNWHEAIERLHATNNFPEFTGRLCPAPCEAACVLGINDDPVTIELVEKTIAERAFEEGWVKPVIASTLSRKEIAVIGSGPSGLAAAQQLTRAGHSVTVFERADRIGGLLRYGIPEFKMEKAVLNRRLRQMEAEGTRFVTGAEVGIDISAEELQERFDAIVLAVGATISRDLNIEGRDAKGIYQAMEYLPLSNKVQEGDIKTPAISAKSKRVVIIGGGDTGADCLGTAHRQGASSITQLEIMAQPPQTRDTSTPWPTWPLLFRTSSAHEEGGERLFSINTERFSKNEEGAVSGLLTHQVEVSFKAGRPVFEKIEGSEASIDADLVLLALGFMGPEKSVLTQELGITFDQRGNIATNESWQTSNPKVFVAGDARRGQSLIVWAIAEGRSVASAIDAYFKGESDLPAPIDVFLRPLVAS